MPDHPVRDLVAQADRQRRFRAAAAHWRRLAPIAAALSLGVGLAGRFLFGWPAWIGVAALSLAAIALGTFAYLQRRPRTTTDAMASAVDADAGLGGELRSAHWFEAQGERDEWAEFHLHHADNRAQGVNWSALYPRDASARPWLLTAILSVAVVAFAIRMPGRVQTGGGEDTSAAAGEIAAALPQDLQAKLAALLAQLDQAAASKDPAAKAASLADLKDLMAKLDPAMQKKLAEMLAKKALEKDTAAAAAQNGQPDPAETAAGTPEDIKWALENQAARMAQSAAEDKKPGDKNAAPSGKAADQQGGQPQAQQPGDAAAESTSPLMREAASEQGNKVMMGGGGPMGGDSRAGSGTGNDAAKGAAEALLVAQALRKEMVEANADALGENVDKEDLRRKTEQGKSGLGFTRAAAPRVEPSRATAPPPVPEARRPLLFTYFIRR